MQDVATIAFYLGVIAYSAASTLYVLDLMRAGFLKASWEPRALGAGGVFHAAHVVSASFAGGACPVESIHFALSLSALMAVGSFLALHRRLRIGALGAVIAVGILGSGQRFGELARSLAVWLLILLILMAGYPFGTPGSTNVLHITRLQGDELRRTKRG